MKKWLWLALFIALLLAVASAAFYYWPSIKNIPAQTHVVKFASAYKIESFACGAADNCDQMSFIFSASENSLRQVPQYTVRELPEEAKTEIFFDNVTEVPDNFTYQQLSNDPLIEDISHEQINKAFILTIKRKGTLAPINISVQGNTAAVTIPIGSASFPRFSELTPADNSAVRPGLQKIQANVSLSDPLKKGLLFLNDQPLTLVTKDMGFGQYLFESSGNMTTDQDYVVKVIVVDSQDRAAIQTWNFGVQKSAVEAVLGKNRFDYLGWWGQINSTSTPVMAEPNNQSRKLDVFSTINRVKVLKEAEGETINDNNIWLQIDGGAHPGAYIFSAYVTPMQQPEPPINFTIPTEIQPDQYWVDVDLTKKVLTLFLYDQPVFATYVATGRPGNPTLTGTYHVWYKLVKTRMRGGPPVVSHSYDLPNVPYVMYYNLSYALHGTYWHDKFGTRQSAGCTNLTQGDAKFIFEKTLPVLDTKKNSVLSNADNPGTIVFNHY